MRNIDNIHEISSDAGKLAVLEHSNVTFDIKRVFYIYEANDIRRGNHAHYETLEYLVCVSGSCDITLDDGTERLTHTLDSPSKGLIKDKLIWITMQNFSKDCVLLSLCSNEYDRKDYIEDYDEFLRITHDKKLGKNTNTFNS